MGKKTSTNRDFSIARTITLFVRGGATMTEASEAVGVPFASARNTLRKFGANVMDIRPMIIQRIVATQQILEATDLLLNGACPQDLYLITGITMRQLILRVRDISRDADTNYSFT